MTRRTIILALGVASLLASPTSASAEVSGDKPPDLAALAKAGRATLERLGRQAASWAATTRLPGDTRVLVEVVTMPTMRRFVLSIEAHRHDGEEVTQVEIESGTQVASRGPTWRIATPQYGMGTTAYPFMVLAEADDAEWMSGKSRNRLAPVLTEASFMDVGPTEAFADTCGAAMLAVFYLIALPSMDGWFALAGQPSHSGSEAQPSVRSRYPSVTLGP
jgi:hypothetical protein